MPHIPHPNSSPTNTPSTAPSGERTHAAYASSTTSAATIYTACMRCPCPTPAPSPPMPHSFAHSSRNVPTLTCATPTTIARTCAATASSCGSPSATDTPIYTSSTPQARTSPTDSSRAARGACATCCTSTRSAASSTSPPMDATPTRTRITYTTIALASTARDSPTSHRSRPTTAPASTPLIAHSSTHTPPLPCHP